MNNNIMVEDVVSLQLACIFYSELNKPEYEFKIDEHHSYI